MKILATFFIFIISWASYAQQETTIPVFTEQLSVTLNETFFVSGEKLLISVRCIKGKAGLSDLSSIAYVELIDEALNAASKLKIPLVNGRGDAVLFIDNEFKTGNYSLIAYTRWMKNFNRAHFFHKTIGIFNPKFLPEQNRTILPSDSTRHIVHETESPVLKVAIGNKVMEKRSRVRLDLTNADSSLMLLTVNVRSADTDLCKDSASGFRPANTAHTRPSILPDHQGELFAGRLVDKDKVPMAYSVASLSSTSPPYFFLVSTTDSDGRYFFKIPEFAQTTELHLNLFNPAIDQFDVIQETEFLNDYDEFKPPKFELTNNMVRVIGRRHLSMQIENIFTPNNDSTFVQENQTRIPIKPDKVYDLSSYTRFPTMEDIFREIIPEIVVRTRDGSYSFVMINSVSGFRFSNMPLVLIDGIPVSDPNTVMQFDPAKITRISLVTTRYFYGGLECEGIIIMDTSDGSAKDLELPNTKRLHRAPITSTSPIYSPTYHDPENLERIPDFRTQLFWNPDVILEPGAATQIDFYTNDLSGSYFVEVTGISTNGDSVFAVKKFIVR